MYKIIGANQAEYGPVTADQLRQWIAEGRVNAQTMAQAAGETAWRPIATFPEFAASFPGVGAPSQSSMPASTPPPFGSTGMPIASDAGRAQALSSVSAPAITLLIIAILTACYSLLGIVLNAAGVNDFDAQRFQDLHLDPQTQQMVERMMQMSGGIMGIIFGVINLVAAGIVIFGAVKMKKLESYGLAMTASILSMIPCLTPCPCCCFGIPVGIWALVVLSKADVKSFFT